MIKFLLLALISTSAFAENYGCVTYGNVTSCSGGVGIYQFGNVTAISTPPVVAPIVYPQNIAPIQAPTAIPPMTPITPIRP